MADYSTEELVGVIETVKTPTKFFLDKFFKIKHTSVSEKISFDEVSKDLEVMAPFVSPLVEAKPNTRDGYQSKTFTPAYVKEKDPIKPTDHVTRLPGEPIGGDLSPESRMDRERVRLLHRHKQRIELRWEWMAAMAVIHGKVTIAGEDYPAVEVDFGRSPSHEVVISDAGQKWDNPAAPVGEQLEDYSMQIADAVGTSATDVLISAETWKKLRKNTDMLEEADRRRGVSNIPILSPQTTQDVSYKGQWGDFHFWVHSGKYRDLDGNIQKYVADDKAYLIADSGDDGTQGLHGIKAFGAIYDIQAGLAPLEMFPKTWEVEEPSVEMLLTQSAPLMIPGRPNAVIELTVV